MSGERKVAPVLYTVITGGTTNIVESQQEPETVIPEHSYGTRSRSDATPAGVVKQDKSAAIPDDTEAQWEKCQHCNFKCYSVTNMQVTVSYCFLVMLFLVTLRHYQTTVEQRLTDRADIAAAELRVASVHSVIKTLRST